jgi:hypothetical protein
MTITVKVGKKEGFVSSYNLFFPNGLRLMTEDTTWACAADKKKIQEQFQSVVNSLRDEGWTIEGTI